MRRLAERFAAGGGGRGHGTNGVDRREHARTILDLVNRGQHGAALAWLRQRLPGEAWKQVLADVPALSAGMKPSEAVALAARLPWRGVIATCLPEAWDRTLKNGRAGGWMPACWPSESGSRTGSTRSCCMPWAASPIPIRCACRRPICAAARAWTRWPASCAGCSPSGASCSSGFRPGDPDLRLILDHLLGAAPTRAEHFLVLPERALAIDSDLQAEILGAELDLVPVLYPGTLEELLTSWTGDGQVAGMPPRPRPGADPGRTSGWIRCRSRA